METLNYNLRVLFEPVEDALEDALLIAWDGCHKMYLAMDHEQADWFRQNYNGVHCDDRTFTGTPKEMLNTLLAWWDESCSLKFISAVTTNHENPNAGFVSLISQDDSWNYENPQDEYDEYDDDTESDDDE